jgi:hypothetical protein
MVAADRPSCMPWYDRNATGDVSSRPSGRTGRLDSPVLAASRAAGVLGVEEVRDQGVGDCWDDREEDEGGEETQAQWQGGSGFCGSGLLVGEGVVGSAGFVGEMFESFGKWGSGAE